MVTKEFIGTCVENPFEDDTILYEMVENAKEISKQTFFKHCNITLDHKRMMRDYPNDYQFYKNKNLYFYKWSAIEYFYN